MRRIIQFAGYTISAIGVALLILWAIRGARPAIDCGIVDAISALDWQVAYTCLDQSDYDPIIAVVTMVGGALLALAARLAPGSTQSSAYNPTPEERQRNRAELIWRVRRIWITGYLQQSLYQEVLLFLGMKWDAAPPPNPFGMTIPRIDGKPQAYQPPDLALTIGAPLAAFYANVDHRLLILGAPGAGKTTVMLDLAKTFLDKAEKDTAIPVPVVFTLSSWPGPETPFGDWLVSEMRTRYGNDIQERVARHRLEHDEIALFLDGLDELPADKRAAAVAAIEAYRALGRWFVVCSRAAEYADLNRHDVAFTNLDAVHIQPLKPYQIQGYLSELRGEQPQRLGEAIAADKTLEEVADTPLMLNVMLLASGAIEWTVISATAADELQPQIYDAYTIAMLSRPRNGPQYGAAKTLHWIEWLAAKMVAHDQTVFLLERLKRSWCNRRWQEHLWGIPIVLACGIMFGLILGSLSSSIVGQILGVSGVLLGSAVGLLLARRDVLIRKRRHLRLRLTDLKTGLIFGLAYLLSTSFTYAQANGLISALKTGSVIGLAMALMFVLADAFASASSSLEQEYATMRVYDGIRGLLRSSLMIGLIFGSLFGSMATFLVGPSAGIMLGLLFGLMYGVAFGWSDVIKHYTLRLVLRFDGSMPLRYVRFLDYSADRILLRKVGGGYMFIHRTFMDHIATLTPERIDALAARVEAATEQAPQQARDPHQRRARRR